ncbi:mannose-6-phosphate isomerase, class I [Vibrio variabilis]|uniref:mannose-6-phosphate isomerase, class I n=1 Tax=Vibrio variabilis TaxID=990271 RepID=UPI000DD68AA4|nr:mannose-6-phosphate isomerase, class I [Vibrio variabilis]
MSAYKLSNPIKNYEWGCKNSLNKLFGCSNPDNAPQAELWMGAHANGCSELQSNAMSLATYIETAPHKTLGEYTAQRYKALPFLFKVLAADAPLSIQVHPSKDKAEVGFRREDQIGLAITDAKRNYKDDNHKPELVYAITSYKAMNGFRPINHILNLFEELYLPSLHEELSAFQQSPNTEGLKAFFSKLLTLNDDKLSQAINELSHHFQRPDLSSMAKEALEYSQSFTQHFINDVGILSPLVLNTIELAPGEAMFLHAETPHAYVRGTALEIMANSDNVLRAGLTPKHIDVQELLDNTLFEPIEPENLKLNPALSDGRAHFPVPVDDFAFDILSVGQTQKVQHLRSAEILFCIDGEVVIETSETTVTLRAGESAFIPCSTFKYQYSGVGKLARAYN